MERNWRPMGTRILQKRKEMLLTQKELANLLHISNNHLSNIETGKSVPSFEVFIEICKILQTNPDYFISGTVYAELDDNILDRIKLCSDKDKIRISKIIDIFLNE